MIYLIATLVTLLNAVWLLTVAANLPGTWLMILTAGLATWVTWPDQPLMGWGVLIAAVVIALIAEAFEFFFGAVGSKQAGGSFWGAVGAVGGAVVGGIVGTFALPIPIVGSIVGACAGAFGGAVLLETQKAGRPWEESILSGKGAAIGRFWGTIWKLAFGFVIWVMLAVAAFWPTPPAIDADTSRDREGAVKPSLISPLIASHTQENAHADARTQAVARDHPDGPGPARALHPSHPRL